LFIKDAQGIGPAFLNRLARRRSCFQDYLIVRMIFLIPSGFNLAVASFGRRLGGADHDTG
jgi:hypothetical protein